MMIMPNINRLMFLLIGLFLCASSDACPTIVVDRKRDNEWIECSDHVFGYFLKYQSDSKSSSDEELKKYWTSEQVKASEEYDEGWIKRKLGRQREIVSALKVNSYYGRCYANGYRCELFLKIEVVQGRFPYAYGVFEVSRGKLVAADLTLETEGVSGSFNKVGPYKINRQIQSLDATSG